MKYKTYEKLSLLRNGSETHDMELVTKVSQEICSGGYVDLPMRGIE